jgi:predicted acyltransferase
MQNGNRMVELDILRGFAVAMMILVVSPGSWEFYYEPLRHADWHGWTIADLVFPDFLFGVGMAMGLTFGASVDPKQEGRRFWAKVAKRVVGLILLGLALNYLSVIAGGLGAPSVGPSDVTQWRIPGILQRIALCFLLATGIVVLTAGCSTDGKSLLNPMAIGAAAIGILALYWALMTLVPVPGFGAGDLSQAGNLAAFIDRAIFTPQHMWPLAAMEWRGPVLYDPEGLLSTLPATANVLFGILAITIWRGAAEKRSLWLLIGGIALIALAYLLDPLFPINKKIWTSSFALLTSGISFLALLLVSLLVRHDVVTRLLGFFRVLGGNAILAFSLSIFLSALAAIPLTGGDQTKNLQAFGYDLASAIIPDAQLASLACALAVAIFVTAIIWPLDRKGIYLRL